ncbi:S-adenosyl-L-methionine-dependent methyltransferase [Saccharata proteae CBS 121410]|uniref:S-adenosyl-L-methionine-dependent methyltransferase n=1 Tax=Saccharata proteae CBS 121410 TaxID=1314787 RepID=A0A6A5YEF7_9PEZI|nr:S-adenosyl-L-methionine-dependent methyltransferase [Saccharata proteae CBS 121410]
MAEQQQPVMEADENAGSSHDSSYGGEDEVSLTTSIDSSIYQYRIEHGRTYHAYKDGHYVYPNDDAEKDRLDLQHHLYLMAAGNKLYLAPIKKNPQNVLDIATGTGLWAIDFADEHPTATVLGMDLSPIQPNMVPPNCSFEVDDANEDWTYSRKFDFIHCRQHHCAIKEKRLFQQALAHLEPGGWLEMQELAFPAGCDDDTLAADSAVARWSDLTLQASRLIQQDLDNPSRYGAWMKEAGFANVHVAMFKFPGNPWPKDKKLKERGLWMMQNHLDGLQGFALGLFTRVHGWSVEEVETFLVAVRRDIKDRGIHLWWPVYYVYGQKPEEPLQVETH